MMNKSTDDLNIIGHDRLATPEHLKHELPLDDKSRDAVSEARTTIKNILRGYDKRLLIVVGPCSIHDPKAALEYGEKLKQLAQLLSPTLFIVMRTYFEKPRTTVGWKGLINDPHLDDSFHIEEGIRIARKLMIDLSKLGLPLATEALDPVTPQYLQDLIAWSAIGARTTESQTHREIASGLSSPVGFKNATDGRLDVAINALKSVAKPHQFLGIDGAGQVSIVSTRGNSAAHIVLRGGDSGPNYSRDHIERCEKALTEAGLSPKIMVDCSHANASKQHERQKLVIEDIAAQIVAGNQSIIGLMIESNLKAGNQSLSGDPSKLEHGVSITDPCIDWETTTEVLKNLVSLTKDSLKKRA
ncbi:MAG: 3-deoxy-7-phosphoheptulonate synthase [Gammaproteobacteria bacterium]